MPQDAYSLGVTMAEGARHSQALAKRLLNSSRWLRPHASHSQHCTPQKFRKGRHITKDGKWELVAEFARLIDEASPDYVTMENVPQLRDHRVFQQFISAINKYHVWHDVIECSEYGVPQTHKTSTLSVESRPHCAGN